MNSNYQTYVNNHADTTLLYNYDTLLYNNNNNNNWNR